MFWYIDLKKAGIKLYAESGDILGAIYTLPHKRLLSIQQVHLMYVNYIRERIPLYGYDLLLEKFCPIVQKHHYMTLNFDKDGNFGMYKDLPDTECLVTDLKVKRIDFNKLVKGIREEYKIGHKDKKEKKDE